MHRTPHLIRLLLPLAVLTLLPAGCEADPPPPASPPELAPCGLADPAIPDLTLTDMNPASPTHDQAVALDDYAGKVLLIFWMRAT